MCGAQAQHSALAADLIVWCDREDGAGDGESVESMGFQVCPAHKQCLNSLSSVLCMDLQQVCDGMGLTFVPFVLKSAVWARPVLREKCMCWFVIFLFITVEHSRETCHIFCFPTTIIIVRLCLLYNRCIVYCVFMVYQIINNLFIVLGTCAVAVDTVRIVHIIACHLVSCWLQLQRLRPDSKLVGIMVEIWGDWWRFGWIYVQQALQQLPADQQHRLVDSYRQFADNLKVRDPGLGSCVQTACVLDVYLYPSGSCDQSQDVFAACLPITSKLSAADFADVSSWFVETVKGLMLLVRPHMACKAPDVFLACTWCAILHIHLFWGVACSSQNVVSRDYRAFLTLSKNNAHYRQGWRH